MAALGDPRVRREGWAQRDDAGSTSHSTPPAGSSPPPPLGLAASLLLFLLLSSLSLLACSYLLEVGDRANAIQNALGRPRRLVLHADGSTSALPSPLHFCRRQPSAPFAGQTLATLREPLLHAERDERLDEAPATLEDDEAGSHQRQLDEYRAAYRSWRQGGHCGARDSELRKLRPLLRYEAGLHRKLLPLQLLPPPRRPRVPRPGRHAGQWAGTPRLSTALSCKSLEGMLTAAGGGAAAATLSANGSAPAPAALPQSGSFSVDLKLALERLRQPSCRALSEGGSAADEPGGDSSAVLSSEASDGSATPMLDMWTIPRLGDMYVDSPPSTPSIFRACRGETGLYSPGRSAGSLTPGSSAAPSPKSGGARGIPGLAAGPHPLAGGVRAVTPPGPTQSGCSVALRSGAPTHAWVTHVAREEGDGPAAAPPPPPGLPSGAHTSPGRTHPSDAPDWSVPPIASLEVAQLCTVFLGNRARTVWIVSVCTLHLCAMWLCVAVWLATMHGVLAGDADAGELEGDASRAGRSPLLLLLCAAVLVPASTIGGSGRLQPPLAAAAAATAVLMIGLLAWSLAVGERANGAVAAAVLRVFDGPPPSHGSPGRARLARSSAALVFPHAIQQSIPALRRATAGCATSACRTIQLALGLSAALSMLLGGLAVARFGEATLPLVTMHFHHLHAAPPEAPTPIWARVVGAWIVLFPILVATAAFPLFNGVLAANLAAVLPGHFGSRRLAAPLCALPPLVGAALLDDVPTLLALCGLPSFVIVFLIPAALQHASLRASVLKWGEAGRRTPHSTLLSGHVPVLGLLGIVGVAFAAVILGLLAGLTAPRALG